ncbi:MAG: cobalamin biosynthesis protein [Micromonosporaceae bacterium]|nr:cobalamin biosynthesis protein [Micromonosporaceae bacterium]
MTGRWRCTGARTAGLALGFAADLAFGDPRRGHPVAGFGRLAAALERRLWADSRRRGVAYAALCVGATAGAGLLARRLTAHHPVAETLVTAAATWAVLGGRSLAAEGRAMHRLLDHGDLDGARRRLSHLAGRDPAELGPGELARATVESLAENTSDAVVAPLLWGAVAGVPGLVGYRAANTLDAMVGHRRARYARFGWGAARLDDLANLLPARVSAALAAAAAPLVGGTPGAARRAWRRDAARHPSPNAGPVEAAFAGALGVTLGGANRYGDRVEDRGRLGDGPAPMVADIPRAVRLSRLVGAGGLAVAAVLAQAVSRGPVTGPRRPESPRPECAG